MSDKSEVEKERERCIAIVQAARAGEIDQDFRVVIHFIEMGTDIEQYLKEREEERKKNRESR